MIIQATHSPLSCIIQIHTIQSHPNPFVEEIWDNLLLFRSTRTCFGTLIWSLVLLQMIVIGFGRSPIVVLAIAVLIIDCSFR